MFTRSTELQELQEIVGRMQALVRQHLIQDFVAHLEDEYQFATAHIDEPKRPSILVWLGQVGGYYAMVQNLHVANEQLDAVRSAILGVFDWGEFATYLDVALNEKYGGKTSERLTIESVVWDGVSPLLDKEILKFSYDARYVWGD